MINISYFYDLLNSDGTSAKIYMCFEQKVAVVMQNFIIVVINSSGGGSSSHRA